MLCMGVPYSAVKQSELFKNRQQQAATGSRQHNIEPELRILLRNTMKNFICLCFVLCFMDQSLCGDPVNITAKPGQQNVDLPCRADRNSKVSAVSLTRGNLEPRYVLLYRDDRIDEALQNQQYLGRTKLQSLNTTDGQIHLTIKNVTEKDSGVYECHVKTEVKSNTRRKRAVLESSTIIQLRVAAAQSNPPQGNMDGNRGEGGKEDGGNKDGLGVSRSHVVLMAPVASVIVSMVIVAVIRRKKIKTQLI
ncbi:uncharacterized protein LOC116722150 isoform X2 [Xiphophorus hellerii]|uniref:uncharacterized protein LOC116722150 isoform X2 n=1 Tax=Xiphophorus hellerii TaxID=8084 RepID=UPI0013B41E54|nr:uncharacterized protein LOC116722150 isoform X2 [Xiphophorus hellerii]